MTGDNGKLGEILASVAEIKTDVRHFGGRLDAIERGLRDNYVAKAEYVRLEVNHETRITAVEGRFKAMWLVVAAVATPVVGALAKFILDRMATGGTP